MPLEKRICNPQDVRTWTLSKAYHDVMSVIQMVSKYITSKPITSDIPSSTAVSCICELLNHLNKKIDSFPAEEQPQRFGNRSYRLWSQWMSENSKELCRTMLFEKCGVTTSVIENVPFEEVLDEVAGYFSESFGNSTRIDYGTGHELAFIAFLACLFKCGVLHAPNPSDSTVPNDYIGIGLVIAPQYLDLVRRLQIYYRMEPAGSHGVWCLDDFQFVPFIWGSSQLIGHSQYGPSSIPERQTAAEEKDRYLLFSCIDYIYQVLGKFPVVQHFLFGQLLTMDRASGPGLSFGGPPRAAGNVGHMPPPSVIPSRSIPTDSSRHTVSNVSATSIGHENQSMSSESAS
ncbi:Serine/threonine-protein phosphatase 2A activator [Fasciolopsis buskii]|uniref:Serine/threonine-protein phosphatase 2A activator n=1 Tax=Fasciolopsis buskii TaxID=27845 RepID=A0A8E0S5Y9_9TREM|nr:Serine/threonine-protein phosphatase 2A activator [Fasciolopsis buski]